jgi:regulator of extracellular matrix RemA (YlzA/DUF370 family)
MATNRVWNLMYYAGNTDRLIDADENPRTRSRAIADAAHVAKTGWRSWVEHARTKERIWESDAEKKAKAKP